MTLALSESLWFSEPLYQFYLNWLIMVCIENQCLKRYLHWRKQKVFVNGVFFLTLRLRSTWLYKKGRFLAPIFPWLCVNEFVRTKNYSRLFSDDTSLTTSGKALDNFLHCINTEPKIWLVTREYIYIYIIFHPRRRKLTLCPFSLYWLKLVSTMTRKRHAANKKSAANEKRERCK